MSRRATKADDGTRIDRAIDHVRAHLGDELTLADLARAAAFSPFHFHRLFTSVTGETPFAFIQRLRIEHAAGALSAHPEQSVLAVALDHGFSSAAAFARAFRARFGMTATEWRAGGAERWRARLSKPDQPNGKHGKASKRRRGDTARTSTREVAMNVRVITLPSYHVAYMRYVGPFGAHGIPELWARFKQWLATHDLVSDGTITLGVAYDDPDITAADRCRYDACVVVPADFAANRHVNLADLPGGRCAVAPFAGTAHEIRDAWDRLYRSWLPTSGYEPDDRPCFEIYRADPSMKTAPGAFRCELCLPVRPA